MTTRSASVPRIRSIINEATSSPTMNSREREVRVKQEGDRSQWSSHKNPRIVRVSRSFGGKDRHSKVCTVRGLRDRRIRLSVPTAIQLYDLQDKLGLSQPSKAVDWLLDNTKNDIDKLPPLPIIPGSFTESPPLNHQSNLSQFLTSNQLYPKDVGKEGIKMMNDERGEKDKWIDHQQENNHEGFVAQNLFPLGGNVNQPSFHTMPYNPYSFHWDHPNLSLSHIGGAYHLPNQQEEQSQNTLPSTSQLYFCPNATTIPTIIPSFPSMENVQQNPLFSTALHLTSPMKSFPFNTYSKSVHPRQNDTGRSGKDS